MTLKAFQYLSMAFAQLTFRESLRDIEVCLRAHEAKLYHLGIRGHVARSNLGDANEKRDLGEFIAISRSLIAQARRQPVGLGLDFLPASILPRIEFVNLANEHCCDYTWRRRGDFRTPPPRFERSAGRALSPG